MNGIKTALITGATGGIGSELCKEFARHGYNLVITATNEERLDAAAAQLRGSYGIRVLPLVLDLAGDGAADELYNMIDEEGIAIDALVNNAGFGLGGYFYTNRPGRQTEMMRVIMGVPTRLCRLFIPDMLRRGHGRILNMASLGSFVPGPMNAVYCASKAYLLSLSEALAEELCDKGIQVTAACPGGTRSRFAETSNMETTMLFNYCVLHPGLVAREAFHAMMRGKRVCVIGPVTKIMVAASRIAPRGLTARISREIQQPFKVRNPYGRGRAGLGGNG
ncbi:MAG: SDR family oxidoreductase [Oscillospiraceae bacterium]|jgi:short-subunit dehydrogenase|nr:SDR family oxidoreductase [Oscillospiraceae bacterium]